MDGEQHRRHRRRVQGLTLVELMVVLAVMGAMLGAAMPAIGASMADRRVAMLARDVAGMFRRARYLSQAFGRAHGINYGNDFGSGLLLSQPWAFETIRGTGASCLQSRFDTSPTVLLEDFNCINNWRCVDHMYANSYDSNPTDDILIRVDGWNWSTFCYEAAANNQVWTNQILASDWSGTSGEAGRGFAVYREAAGDPVGVIRKVFIPFGVGTPRIMR